MAKAPAKAKAATATVPFRMTPLRLGLYLPLGLLALGTMFGPDSATHAIPLACAAVAIPLGVVAYADLILDGWLRRNLGEDVTLFDFAVSRLGGIARALGALVAFFSFALLARIDFSVRMGDAVWYAAMAGTALFASGCLLDIVSLPVFRRADPAESIRQRLRVVPLRRQLAQAWDFQRYCGPRLALPLLIVAAVAALLLALCGAVAWALIAFAHRGGTAIAYSDILEWPPSFTFGVFAGIVGGCTTLATSALAAFRIVARARRTGRYMTDSLARDVGYAFESAGFLGTAGWGLCMALALGVVGFAAFGIASALTGQLGMSPIAAAFLSAVFGGAAALLLVAYPQMFVLPIMARRDCGWMNAFLASLRMASLEGREGFVKFLAAAAFCTTVVGIPAGVALLLGALDNQELVLAAIFGEKTQREVDGILNETEIATPAALKKPYDALAAGRYLDALNGFQMFLHFNKADPAAQRGVALAMLMMGNPRAREALEVWLRIDPEDMEAARLMAEFQAGLWTGAGAKLQEAQRKCTQKIGIGVGPS